ncbi:protein-L-isoaspartate O-methyltransferase family protein [Amycolatopsis sp. VC5-11]|uniref:protein-L-isoaspartate O-methyltransferase family protein n=1 Tax=Amycolatopsis sp. VC5-11 TaxID=3120156 RepID=UPI00300BDC1C
MANTGRADKHRVGPASLADRLNVSGTLAKRWESAFVRTNRSAFVPRHAWVDDGTRRALPIERGTTDWLRAVFSDTAIVTRFDERHATWPDIGRRITGFLPQPSAVLRVLGALDLQPWHTVLVIGAGTGYLAALLGAYLGDQAVTAVETGNGIQYTRDALRRTGHDRIEVISGDGQAGIPQRAPYSRIVSTAEAVAGHIPTAWLRQTVPGGMILTPWATGIHGSGVLKLGVLDSGIAHGHIMNDVTRTRLRPHPLPSGHAERMRRLVEDDASATESFTWADPREIGEDPNVAMAIGLHLPGVQRRILARHVHRWEVLLYDIGTGSSSICYVTPESTHRNLYKVRQYGPEPLWEHAVTAWRWWQQTGRPDSGRFGVTMTPARQWCWLDKPDNLLPVLLEPEVGGLR